ncbi:hypothetical protein M011DRAFT_413337 [Sporormia fimetaria CBS 119925]|uniref:Nucleic acid-binding protein n=1 Tax=Sporormia fimetaria CBS 119925 TaxID=1340428 RepID=A0A6A6UWC9_9PLEO|nr:hypothetical protein M011DRAFT_413337 [Sporormia fimetaria CBS 119925]
MPHLPPTQSILPSHPPRRQHATPHDAPAQVSDGFTANELDAVLRPTSAQWTPAHDYDEVDIGDLEAGPRFVTVKGRIVNIYNMARPSKRPMAAKGCLKLVMADDTGALTVRLWYADVSYAIFLGQLVTLWTVHVSHGEQTSLASPSAPLFTSIFPERERSTYLFRHAQDDDPTLCRRPYGCDFLEPMPCLLTLKNFVNGGYEMNEARLLLCVKGMGSRKTFTTKNGYSSELVSVRVFDDTAEAILTITGSLCNSVSLWRPCHTVLLVSNPSWRLEKTTKLGLKSNTRIDIDPDTSDALWLRSFADRLTKNEHVNPPFPDSVFDLEYAKTAPTRVLYTLADIDEFARENPKECFVGYISVILADINLVLNSKRNMLMSTECCGNPIYANSVQAKCETCQKQVLLRINPKIINSILDETGEISSGKLIFSDAAWQQLLGRTPEQLVQEKSDVLEFMEQRMLFLRITLGFAWCLEGTSPRYGKDGKMYLQPWTKKRKRLHVFTEKGAVKDAGGKKESTQVGESGDAGTKGKEEMAPEVESSGVGGVGRLCIWCVSM